MSLTFQKILIRNKSQLLCYRYMHNRCQFLDCFPGFNYNTGAGEYKKNSQGELVATNTRELGSSLMETMLKEVSDFCDPAIKENWSLNPHQQVRGGSCPYAANASLLLYS